MVGNDEIINPVELVADDKREHESSVSKEHEDMDIEQESEDNSSVTREEPDGAEKQSKNLSKIK